MGWDTNVLNIKINSGAGIWKILFLFPISFKVSIWVLLISWRERLYWMFSGNVSGDDGVFFLRGLPCRVLLCDVKSFRCYCSLPPGKLFGKLSDIMHQLFKRVIFQRYRLVKLHTMHCWYFSSFDWFEHLPVMWRGLLYFLFGLQRLLKQLFCGHLFGRRC